MLPYSNNVALKADGDTLAEGYNYFATVSAAATVTLPASPTVGDTVIVKAKDGVSETNYIAINRAGSHTIDGETSVRIESPYGALSMVYVAANDWRIV
jgi:VCBS repeat-containing protein